MNSGPKPEQAGRLTLWADSAADLMTTNPAAIRDDATVKEALTLLADKGLNACPVVDKAGQLVGVLSKADLLVHEREKADHSAALTTVPDPTGHPGEPAQAGGEVRAAPNRVRDIMTPAVFWVTPETPAGKVVAEMLALKVNQLFVVAGNGGLAGVISAFDILRHLRP